MTHRPGSQRPAMPAAQGFFGFSESLKLGVVIAPFSQGKGSQFPTRLVPQALLAGHHHVTLPFRHFTADPPALPKEGGSFGRNEI